MIDLDTSIQPSASPALSTYRVATISAPGRISFHRVEKPAPQSDEVLVRLAGCGLCASNLPVWEGRDWFDYPQKAGAPGHEGWGTVESVGPQVQNLQPGQYVTTLNQQAFAEYVLLKAADAIPLPESMRTVPFPGEPFGCTMNILRRADIRAGQTVAIIGMGFLGLSLIPLIRRQKARVIALSRSAAALEKAAELGADEAILMDDHYRVTERIRELTQAAGCERVIECTGKQWPLDLAGELTGFYGKLIIAGYHQDGPRSVNVQQWNWKALDVINAHERDPEKYRQGIREAVRAVQNHLLDPDDFLTHCFDFEDLDQGLNFLLDRPAGSVKAYIKFQ